MTDVLALTPLDDLIALPARKNPRGGHRVGALCSSLRAHGFGQAVTVNRTTRRVLAGNGRTKALAAMRRNGEPAPRGVTVDPAGRWLVPTFHGDWPEADEGNVALALNGGLDGSLEGEWNDQAIADLLAKAAALDLAALGIGETQAQQFIADHEAPTCPPQINLDGIETIPQAGGQSTIRLVVSESTAARVRRLTARGITSEEIVTRGIDRVEKAHDRPRGPASAPQAECPAAVG